jgi:hypothetical protein
MYSVRLVGRHRQSFVTDDRHMLSAANLRRTTSYNSRRLNYTAGKPEISRVFKCFSYWMVCKSPIIRWYLFNCPGLSFHGSQQYRLSRSVGKCIPLYTLLDFDYNSRIQEIVSNSFFILVNVDTKVKYR